jgi:phosphate transport system permease protein
VDLEIYVDPAKVDAKDPAKGNYRVLIRDSLASLVPEVANPKDKADLAKILTSDAA